MRAVFKIEYNPEDIDEQGKIDRIIKTDDAFYCLYEIKDHVRSIYKYSDIGAEISMAEKLMEFINDLYYDNGINLDKDYR